MDPLTCFSVAGTCIQLVDFSSKVLLESWRLYKDGGSLEIHEQAQMAAIDLSNFNMKLRQSLQEDMGHSCSTEERPALERLDLLCTDCIALSSELIQRLEKLKVKEKGRKWKSLTQALAGMWSKAEITAMQQRLDQYRAAIDSRLLGDVRSSLNVVSCQQISRFDRLDEQTKQIILAILDSKNLVARDLQAQNLALTQLLTRCYEVVNCQNGRLVVDGLQNSTLPAGPSRTERTALQQELAQLTPEQRTHLLAVARDEELVRKTVSQELVQSLWFSSIEERLDDVDVAHKKTLEWIFNAAKSHGKVSSTVHWSNFVQWLREGDGIYWINGKPAAGKSTLMKYIFQNPSTVEHLSAWANGQPLHFAGFFFWNSGTKLQKSQLGLLRSLLHQILSKMPALIPILFPTRWAARYAAQTQTAELHVELSWSLDAVSQAFQILLCQTTMPLKMCLFIDGLDEYEGSDIDIAQLFGAAANHPHIKICVSSRPHVVFEDAFRERPGLRLQDLIVLDIQRYVNDRLLNDPKMQEVSEREPVKASMFMNEIVLAANGVFLWVKLVVTSLLKGLNNHDSITILQKRLRELPRDLKNLYRHMIINVDSVYQEEAFQIFRLLDTSQEAPDDWAELGPLTLIALIKAMEDDHDSDDSTSSKLMSGAEMSAACKDMDSRIKTRCGGLLEVHSGSGCCKKLFPTTSVVYIHRTVRDFLVTQETRKLLEEKSRGTLPLDYDPVTAMFKSCLLQLKYTVYQCYTPQLPASLFNQAITYARRGELSKRPVSPELLDALWRRARCFKTCQPVLFAGKNTSMACLAAQCGLNSYLQSKKNDSATSDQEAHLLQALFLKLWTPQ